MRNVLNIVKKELDKIFYNPRLIFSTFILPGLIIFIMYTFMGNSFSMINAETTGSVYLINNPGEVLTDAMELYENTTGEDLNVIFVDYEKELTEITDKEIAEFKQKIDDKEVDAYLFFEPDFNEKITSYVNKEIDVMPKILYFGNSTVTGSQTTVNKLAVIVDIINQNKIFDIHGDINLIDINQIELADQGQLSGFVLAMLLPMLIMTFVFAGGLSVGPDAIAGEKERGTMATLLMTPIKKEDIVLGKIISTVIITILSAIGSFIGIAASLPNMGGLYGDATMGSYGFVSYVEIFILIILIALMASCLFLTASTVAKTIKEASAYSMPMYIIAILVGMSTMFMDTVPTSIWPYLIPIYNLTLGLKAVFLNQLTLLNIVIISLSTLVYFVIILFGVSKLFKSENLMFAK